MSKQLKKFTKSIRNSFRRNSLSESRPRTLKAKLMLSVAAIGSIFMPWSIPMAQAAITASDSNMQNTIQTNGNITNVYAQNVSGTTGLNRFTEFSVEQGNIANMHFTDLAKSAQLNNLINTVQNPIDISGTVNAIRNNQIGGNLFFLSPGGMVINGSGAVNAGSLTVMTPTKDFFEKAGFNVKETIVNDKEGKEVKSYSLETINLFNPLKTEDEKKQLQKFMDMNAAKILEGKIVSLPDPTKNELKDVAIALNKSASITVHGQINAQTAMKLVAGKSIDISKDDSGVAPILRTGVVFKQVVNPGDTFGVDENAKMQIAADDNGNLVLTDASGDLTGDGSITLEAQATGVNYKNEESSDLVKFASLFGNAVDVDKISEVDSILEVLGLEKEDDLKELLSKIKGTGYTYDPKNITYQDVWACYTSRANDTALAEISVGKGAIVKAPGKINITATSTLDVTPPKPLEAGTSLEERIKKDYNLAQQMANTKADVIINGQVTGQAVNATASASSTFTADGGNGLGNLLIYNKKIASIGKLLPESLKSDVAKEKIAGIADLANKLNVALGFVNSEANVKVGQNANIATVKPTAEYSYKEGFIGDTSIAPAGDISLNASSSSVTNIGMSLVPTKEKKDAQGEVTEKSAEEKAKDADKEAPEKEAGKNGNSWFNGGLIWEQTSSKANVNVEGKLNSQAGINLSAAANNNNKANLSVTPLVIKDEKKGDEYKSTPAYINLALGLINQDTTSKVTVGYEGVDNKESLLQAVGAVNISATDTINLDSTVGVKSDDTQAVSSAINIINSTNTATVDNYAQIQGTGVSVSTTDILGTPGVDDQGQPDVTKDKGIVINTSNSLQGIQEEKKLDKEKAPSEEEKKAEADPKPADADAAPGAGKDIEVDAAKDKAENLQNILKAEGDKNKDAAGEDVTPAPAAGETSTGWNKYFDLGASVTVANFTNDAIVNLRENSKIISSDGDATINALVKVVDSKLRTENVFVNNNADTRFGVNAAVTVENFNNTANVTMAKSSSVQATGSVQEQVDEQTTTSRAANISIGASADNDYNRWLPMKIKIANGCDSVVKGLEALGSENNWQALKEAAKDDNARQAIENLIRNEALKSIKAELLKGKSKYVDLIADGMGIDLSQLVPAAELTAEQYMALFNLVEKIIPLVEGVGSVAEGLANIKDGIKDLKDATNFINVYTSASVAEKDKGQALAMINGSVGIQNINNHANVIMIEGASLLAANSKDATDFGNVDVNAIAKGGNVNFAGKFKVTMPAFDTTSGGEVGIGGTVGVQNGETTSKVSVQKGAEIYGKNVSIGTDNKVVNAVGTLGGATNNTVGLTGMVSYLGGKATATTEVDSQANINAKAGKLDVTAKNNTILTNLAGNVSESSALAVGASVGLISYQADSIASIARIANLDGSTDSNSWTLNGLNVQATNDGVINNLTVAGVTVGGERKEKAGADVSVKDDAGNKTNIDNLVYDAEGHHKESDPAPAPAPEPAPADPSIKEDADGGNGPEIQQDAEASSKKESSIKIGAAGSVSLNKINNKTVAELADVNFANNLATDEISVNAEDASYAGAYSGAMARTKSGAFEKDNSKFNATLAGAVGINDLTKNTSALIKNTQITNGALTNKAVNSGAQVAAGVGLTAETGGAKGFTAVGSASVNLIDSTVNANIKNAQLTTLSALKNVAYDKDVQVAGGVSADYAKTSVGIGAAVSVENVKNNITASIKDSTITDASYVNNRALSKLTQVGSAVSVGIAGGEAAYASINGAIAVNKVKNDLKSFVDNSSITANSVKVEVADGTLRPGDAEHKEVTKLKELTTPDESKTKAFNLEGEKAIENAKDLSVDTESADAFKLDSSGDYKKLSDGTFVELTPEEKTSYSGDKYRRKNEVVYKPEAYSIQHSGNTIVGSAVGVDVSSTKNPGAALSASVVYDFVDNDFTANVKNSAITVKGTGDEDKLSVAANSDTLIVSSAAGVATKTGGGKGAASGGSVVLSYLDNDTKASIENNNNQAITANKVDVTAKTASKNISVGGEVGVSTGGVAAGLTWAQNSLNNTTEAHVSGADISGTNLVLKVDAENNAKNYAIAAASNTEVRLKNPVAIAATGAYAANTGVNNTKAIIYKSTIGNDTAKANAIDVHATDNTVLKGIAGTVTIGVGGTKVDVNAGGSVVNNKIGDSNSKQKVLAQINDSSIKLIDKSTDAKLTEAANLNVKAENYANVLSVAAGGAVGFSKSPVEIGASGSVAVDNIYTLTDASMTDTDINADSAKVGNVNINAISDTKVVTTADALSINVDMGKVAGGAMATVAKANSDADTTAGIYGKTKKVTQNVKDETVKADSKNKITNVAVGLNGAGGAGLASVGVLGNVAINKIANDTKAEVNNAKISADNLGVLAMSNEQINNYGGALNVSINVSKAGVSVGATTVVNTILGDTTAIVNNSELEISGDGAEKKGLVVNADAAHTLNDISVTAGVGGSALAGVAVNATTGVNNISGATKAQVLNTDINKDKAEADYQNADVSIKANDYTKVSAHVGTLSSAGAGTASVTTGAAVDNNKFNREVTAEFVGGSDKNTIQAKNIDINADNTSKVLLTQSGASIGAAATAGVGVTGAVSVDHFTSKTSANLQNAKVNSSGNVKVEANSSKDIATYTNAVSLTGGYVAVAASAAVDVIKENSNTIASISYTDIDKAKDVTLKANNENILKHEFAQGGLAIGLGGSVGASVGVNNFHNTVKTDLKNSNIGSKTISVDSFTDLAKNKITDQFTNVNANGGLGAIGVGVGVNTIDTGALTNIEWTNVYAKSIDVKAEEERNITEQSVGASIGAGAINTSVMINNIGTALQDVYTEPENPNAEYRIQGIKDKVAEGFKDVNANNTALSEQGFTKGVVSKDKDYEFDMGGKGQGVQTNLIGSKLIATGTAENERLSIKSHAKTETNVTVGEGAAAIGKIGVTVAKTNIDSKTGVNIEGGTYQGQNVNIESLTDGEIKQMAVSGNIGGGFINVAVDTVTKTGDNVITIDNASIKATKNYKDANNVQGQLNIQALDQSKIENSSTNVTAGVAVIGAMFAKSYDHSNVGVEIKNNVKIENVNYNVVEQEHKLTADISIIKVYDELGNETTYEIGKDTTTKEVEVEDPKNPGTKIKQTIECYNFYYLDKDKNKVYLENDIFNVKEYKPVYGDVNIYAKNSNEVQSDIKLITASLGVSGQGSVALAEVGQRDASGKVVGGQAKINISGTGNKFVGNNVSLISENQAKTKANLEASGGTLGLSIGVSKAEAKLQGGTAVEIASGQTFVANDVNFASTGASLKNENDNNAEATITGGSGSAVIITVNNANAIANTESILNVGSEKYQTGIWEEVSSESHEKQNIAQAKEQATDQNTENKEIRTETTIKAGRASVKDGGTNVNMLLGSAVSTFASAKGLDVGVVASGTNKAYTTNTSKTILNFNPGTFEAESLRIAMGNGDKSNTLANGNGGGIVGISPVAARAEHNNDSEVTLNIGNDQTETIFNLEKDFYLGVANVVEEEINSNAIQAAIAGGSGVEAASTNISNANLNLTNTTINAKGEVALDAENYHDFNKATDYVIKGNGYGIGYVDIAKFNNVITQNANVNLKYTTIVSQGKVDIAAHNDNNIKSNIYVLSAGGVAGAFATNTIDFNSSSLVDIDNASAIRADGLNSDITLAASDQNKITTMTMAESIGAIGTPTTAKNNNNITRNNKVTVDGTIYGRHDVRLFAGRNEHDEDSSLTLSTYAEAFNKTAIPLGSLPSINNNLNQNNQVYIKDNGQINAVKDVNIYADAGKETYDIFSNAYTSWGSKGNSKVVVSTNGKINEGQSIDIYGRKTDNHVQVDGAVTAGIANYQKIVIGQNGWIILNEEQYNAVKAYYDSIKKPVDESIKVLTDNPKETYHVTKADLIKVYGNEEGTIPAEAAGINVDDFKLGTRNYGSELMKRREELGKLLTHYADSQEYAAYVGYKAEYDQITDKLKALGIIDKEGNINGEILVNYVEVPDLISYGGNVNVSTNNFFSSNATGSVTAKGNPTVKIENKTSLATNINNITVDGKGGAIYYNTLDMAVNSTPETITETIKKNIRNQNLDKSKTVAKPSSAIGTRDGLIDIAASYSNTTELQTELQYINTDITDPEDPSYQKVQKMPLKPDLIINGSVAAENGSVSIVNRNGDITIESKTAGGKGAEVVGKTVTIKAEGGSVTQAYQDTIVNIGGDPEQKYLFDYDKDGLKNIRIVQVDAGARIAGENVYINAADINVNGTIQSGYDKYSVEIAPDTKLDSNLKVTTGEGKTVTERIQQIIDKNKGAAVTDNDVVGNYNYLVIAGDTVKNDKGIYEKRIDVYYNPTTNKLVLPSVNSNGGRVYLTGRIASTGDGKINCMDGTYDIAVKNTVDKDLQLGQMVVNDTQGVISITDTRRIIKYNEIVDGKTEEKFGALVTEYTRGEDGTVNVKFTVNGKEQKFTEEELKDLGINNSTYTPVKNITYNWTKGQNVGQKKVYTQTWYNKWWGASKSPSEFTTETQAQEPKLTPVVIPGETIEKAQGAFIGDLKETTMYSTKTETKGEFTVYWKRENKKDLVYLNKDVKDNPYHWSSGYLNCHKNTRVVWTHEVSNTDTYVASVKADNPIAINFIGNGTGESKVDVSSTKNITLTGDIGNRQLYENNNALEEKGRVNIVSTGGLIEQTGGSIYGRNVTLSADGKFSNINLALGDTMDLTINQAADAKQVDRDISVIANSNGSSKGNLLLNNIGSSKTNIISIVNKGNEGNIEVAADKVISANRIDLTTTNGSVNAFVEASQTPYSNDTLSASINVTAGGDINLTQKTGNMRIGTIRSINGDVTLNVPDGSVVDALPYSKNSDASENDLVEKWLQAGLINDTAASQDQQKVSSNLQDEKNAQLSAANNMLTNYKNFKADESNLRTKYDAYTDALENYNKVYASRSKYDSEEKYKAACEEALNKVESLKSYEKYGTFIDKPQEMTDAAWQQHLLDLDNLVKLADENPLATSYEVWDKNALLYSIQNSIVNPTTVPKPEDKAPNVRGNNITLNVKDSAGLLSDKVTTYKVEELDVQGAGLENLKAIARADASSVTWHENDNTITIQEKLPIGVLLNSEEGKLNIANYQSGKSEAVDGSVYIQNRLDPKSEESNPYKDINVAEVKATGDVSIHSIGAIYNAVDPAAVADAIAIMAKNLELAAMGDIGTADKNLTTDINGGTLAAVSETGNIYIDNIGTSDIYLKNMAAPKGAISVKNDQNIYATDNYASEIPPYVQAGDTITLISRKASVGALTKDGEDEDGMPYVGGQRTGTKGKAIRVLNNGKQVTVKAAENVYVEGISTDIGSGTKNPAGTLLLEASNVDPNSKLKNVGVYVNGTLQLTGDLKAQETISLDTPLDLKLASELEAKNIKLRSGKNLEINEDALLQAKNINLTAKENITEVYDLEKGTGSKLITNYTTIDDEGKEVYNQGQLTINNGGTIDLGSKNNMLGIVNINNTSAQADNVIKLGSTGNADLELTIKNETASDKKVAGSIDVRNYESAEEKQYNDIYVNEIYAKGDLKLTNDEDTDDTDVDRYGIFIGKIPQYDSGTKEYPGVIDVDGRVDLIAKGVVNNEQAVINEDGSVVDGGLIIAGKDINIQARNFANGDDAKIFTGASLTATLTGEDVDENNRDYDVAFNEGTIIAGKDINITTTNEKGSIANFGTLHAGNTEEGSINLDSQNNLYLIEIDDAALAGGENAVQASKDINIKARNYMLQYGALLAGEDIKIDVGGDAIITGDFDTVSNTGNYLVAENNVLINVGGDLLNQNAIVAATGEVSIKAEGSVINLQQDGEYTFGEKKNVTLDEVINDTLKKQGIKAVLEEADFSDGVVYANKDITLEATKGDVVNASVLESYQGDIKLASENGSVINKQGADIVALGGDVNLEANGKPDSAVYYIGSSGDLFDKDAVPQKLADNVISCEVERYYKVGAEDWKLITPDTKVPADAKIKTEATYTYLTNPDDPGSKVTDKKEWLDDVAVFQKGSVVNYGDIIAINANAQEEEKNTKGSITLKSEHTDVFNYDDFNKSTNETDISTEYLGLDKKSYNVAAGNISLLAPEGEVYNSKKLLVALGDVTIEAAKGMDSFGDTIYAGKNINLTATEGDLVNKSKLISLEGNVTLTSKEGAVVNLLNADIEALGTGEDNGNVNLNAGGEATDGIKFVDTNGNKGTLEVTGLEAENILVAHKFYLSDATGEYVQIDDTTNVSELSNAEQASLVTVFGWVTGDGNVKYADEYKATSQIELKDVEFTYMGQTLKGIQKDIEAYRTGDVVNRGDIIAQGSKGVQLVSEHANVANYDNFSIVDGLVNEKGERIYQENIADKFNAGTKFNDEKYNKGIISVGDIGIHADEGYIYNNMDIITDGNVDITSGKDLTSGLNFSRIEAGKNVNISSKGNVNLIGKASPEEIVNILSKDGIVSIASENGDVNVKNFTIEARNDNPSSGPAINGSIVVTSTYGNIDLGEAKLLTDTAHEGKGGTIIAAVGVGATDPTKAIQNITLGKLNAGQVVVLNENINPGSKVTLTDTTVNNFLVVEANEAELGKIQSDSTDTLNVAISGVDGAIMKGEANISFDGDMRVHTLNVEKANLDATGNLAIDTMHTNGKIQTDSMGFTTSIYGGPIDENDTSDTIYFDIFKSGFGFDLKGKDKLAYLDKADPEEYDSFIDKRVNALDIITNSLLTSKNTPSSEAHKDGSFYLDTFAPNYQESNGLLLHRNPSYYVHDQRYSLEDLTRKLDDTKSLTAFHDNHANEISLYNRYNLYELADGFEEGLYDYLYMEIDREKKKDKK